MIALNQVKCVQRFPTFSIFKILLRKCSQKNITNINNISDSIRNLASNQDYSIAANPLIWKVEYPLVIISELDDPYLNLAVEHYAFLEKPINSDSSQRLVLYNNCRSIIIGKNQNPWKEINFQYLKEANLLNKINILRRYSGGGTVIHDKGNLNYSFMTTKNKFNRKVFSNIIIEEINDIYYNKRKENDDNNTFNFGPKYPIRLNQRGDLVAFSEDKEEYKISGSAYKVTKGKSLHHGTMLLNCDISQFKNILNGKCHNEDSAKFDSKIVDRSVDSNRVKVRNLEMNETLFQYCLINGFLKNYGMKTVSNNQGNLISNGKYSCHFLKITKDTQLTRAVYDIANELKSWKHKFGKTPKFEHVIMKRNDSGEDVRIKMLVEEGFITQFDIKGINTKKIKNLEDLMAAVPIKYDSKELEKYIKEKPWRDLFIKTIL